MKQLYLLSILLGILWGGNIVAAQGWELGKPAPEIILPTPDGNEIKLSDLRGKIVLVDFWASWCSPCRKENPVLVHAYNEYKDTEFKNAKGFVVLSISIDSKRELWLKAIEKDNLNWPYNVSDLKGWRSEVAKTYNVKMIPASFLVDGDGIIIDVNLRGEKLESALKKNRASRFWRFGN